MDLDPSKRVIYVHSEKFVADMVKALQLNAINEFKNFYRTADALLIDDIQFFAGKEQSQEEFFHTFNALLDRNNQMVLTCDKYPKEIDGLGHLFLLGTYHKLEPFDCFYLVVR